MQFKTPYGWVDMSDLSLGYRTLMALGLGFSPARLHRRYPTSRDPLAEPAVALVDEIDLHLHPQWQRDLLPFLTSRFKNTQFIVTAHSPLVVQAAPDARLILLRREGDHVVIDSSVTQIRNWRVDQILTSDLFGLESARPPHLAALLEERRKLLARRRPTARDELRLRALEAEIGTLPVAETAEQIEAMRIIREAAEHLQTPRGSARPPHPAKRPHRNGARHRQVFRP